MEQARWIWYYGDFELYHNILLHNRREDYGISYPCFWPLPSPFVRVDFTTVFTALSDTEITVVSNADGYVVFDHDQDVLHRALNTTVSVPAGEHTVKVVTHRFGGLPAIFIDSPYLKTNAGWTASAGGALVDENGGSFAFHAGDEPGFLSPNDTPEVFPFSYRRMEPICHNNANGVLVFDFGTELFGLLNISGTNPDAPMLVVYGESLEEASDSTDNAKVWETVSGRSDYTLKARGFRYVGIHAENCEHLQISADYEFLPVPRVGTFSCDRASVKNIYDTSAYTLELCSREFYLDGIKRDRWLWSGDAYQSYLINRYFNFDSAIIRRTIIATIGKPPYAQHINAIPDYSCYALLAVYEYYMSTGDLDFVRFIYPRAAALYEFLLSRLDENGFYVARSDDWLFIDWSPMDKTGAVCAMQILLWQTHRCMAGLCRLLKADAAAPEQRADALQTNINRLFWCEEQGGFIDSYTSGKNNITRHANIFALLFEFANVHQNKQIIENVLNNPAVSPITTPYFAFYELIAMCKCGRLADMQDRLESYWGGMLSCGATTIWEQYDPAESGTQHYAMYGQKYGRSLCHAWGSGPVYLLGRFCAGIYPTSVGYATFAVEPNPGKYKHFSCTVPIQGGTVQVEYTEDTVQVLTNCAGGVLLLNGKSYPIEQNIMLSVTL